MSVQSPDFADSLFEVLAPHFPEFAYPASRVSRLNKGDSITAVTRPAHGLNSNIRLYRYTEGQHFGQHYDDAVTDSVTGLKSEWTLLIYLSGMEDGVVGGEVSQSYSNRSTAREADSVFHSLLPHQTIFYKPGAKKKDRDVAIKPELRRGMALLHR